MLPESLRLLADYLCFPVWTDDKGDIDPSTLPISKKLAEELLEWAHFYNTKLDQEYPPDSHFDSAEEKDAFVENGRILAKRLQEELGRNYEIEYIITNMPGPEEIPAKLKTKTRGRHTYFLDG